MSKVDNSHLKDELHNESAANNLKRGPQDHVQEDIQNYIEDQEIYRQADHPTKKQQEEHRKENNPEENAKLEKKSSNISTIVVVILLTLNLVFSSVLGGIYLTDRSNAVKKSDTLNQVSPSSRQVAAEPVNQTCTLYASEIPNDWIYMEPQWVGGFNGLTQQDTLLKFDHIISNQTKAKQILVVVSTRNGWAGGGVWFGYNVRTSVKNGEKEFMHYTYGHRGDNNAAVWNSETVRFPIHNTRQFRVKPNRNLAREFFIEYFIIGHRLL